MTEEQLIQGCIQNDRRCQNELYKRYFPLMSSIALRYCKDDQEALSVLNEGFYKVLVNMAKYNPDFTLATWIRNILVNHIISEFRKNRSYQEMIKNSENPVEAKESTYNHGELSLHENDLLKLIQKLPQITGKVFNLFAIDGYKHQEISEMLGIQEGTSKWHVNEARKRLRFEIEKMNHAGEIKLDTGS